MSDGGNDILIIKRHGGHEEEHHGGAWKIAFADFMTAMMAFFLVLWIVNSTNKETRTVIARYFNPVKLEDLSRSKKGIRDDKEKNVAGDASGPGSDKGEGGTAAPAPPPGTAQRNASESEAALIANPSESLDAIVARDEKAKRENARADGFANPFAPSRQESSRQEPSREASSAHTIAPSAPSAPAERTQPTSKSAAEKLANDIMNATRSERGEHSGPHIQAQVTSEGVLISLMDDAAFSMFAIGSAQPDAKVIALVGKIAEKLKTQSGAVIVRGHTDARPFRSPHYDNWRLSSMRAQMVFYMLTRAGLDEARIERVEGYGARKPRNVGDPFAAENRRIEILLRMEKP